MSSLVSARAPWLSKVMPYLPGAACARAVRAGIADPEDWFPNNNYDTANLRAIRICKDCPVVQECGEWSIRERGDLHGIWAGMGRPERDKHRRKAAKR